MALVTDPLPQVAICMAPSLSESWFPYLWQKGFGADGLLEPPLPAQARVTPL